MNRLLIFVIFVQLFSCTNEFNSRGPYRIALLGRIPDSSMDPSVLEDYNLISLLGQVCGRLTTVDQDMQVGGDIALSWKLDREDISYTFLIDTERKFFNGKNIKPEDIVFSIKRAQTSGDIGWLSDISNVEKIKYNEVKITFKKRNPRLLYQLASSSSCILNSNEPFIQIDSRKTPNSAGAYKITSIKEKIVLTKNINFPEKHLEPLIEVYFLNQLDALEMFDKKKIDDLSFYLLSKPDIERLKQKKVLKNRVFWSWVISLNPTSIHLNTVEARKDFFKSMDRKKILEDWQASVIPGSSLIPKGMQGYREFEGKLENSTFTCSSEISGAIVEGVQNDKKLKESIEKNFLRSTGCKLKLDILEMGQWGIDHLSGKYDFYISAVDTNSPDSLGFYRYFVKGFKENALGYNDAVLNDVYKDLYSKELSLRTSSDYLRIDSIFKETHYSYVLGYPVFEFVYASDVVRAHMHPLGMHMNRWWDIGRNK